MELVATQYQESFVDVCIHKVRTKAYTKAEINKSLTLLGFNSWTKVEPSKPLAIINYFMSIPIYIYLFLIIIY